MQICKERLHYLQVSSLMLHNHSSAMKICYSEICLIHWSPHSHTLTLEHGLAGVVLEVRTVELY